MKNLIIFALLILLSISCISRKYFYDGTVVHKYKIILPDSINVEYHIIAYCDTIKSNLDIKVFEFDYIYLNEKDSITIKLIKKWNY